MITMTPEAPAPVAEYPDTPPQPMKMDVGSELNSQLLLINTTIRRPTGRIKVANLDVQAANAHGEQQHVDLSLLTSPQWKLDKHELYREIDKTAAEIGDIRRRYGVPVGNNGIDLVPIRAWGAMLTEVMAVRDRRRELVRDLVDVWDTEVMPGLEKQIGEHFDLIRSHVYHMAHVYDQQLKVFRPAYERMAYRFDVIWDPPRPIGRFDPDNLDFGDLSHDEAERLIAETRDQYNAQLHDMYDGVFASVFGELGDYCHDLLNPHRDPKTGEMVGPDLDTRKKNYGKPIADLMDLLERIDHFRHFTPPEILAQAKAAQQALAGVDANIHNAHNLKQAVRAAMAPLTAQLKEIGQAPAGRAARAVLL